MRRCRLCNLLGHPLSPICTSLAEGINQERGRVTNPTWGQWKAPRKLFFCGLVLFCLCLQTTPGYSSTASRKNHRLWCGFCEHVNPFKDVQFTLLFPPHSSHHADWNRPALAVAPLLIYGGRLQEPHMVYIRAGCGSADETLLPC